MPNVQFQKITQIKRKYMQQHGSNRNELQFKSSIHLFTEAQ